MKKRVVLAFSGGLDTSYCVKYLSTDCELEVHTVTVNTGGFSNMELSEIEVKAYQLGAHVHVCLEKTEDFYHEVVKYLVYGNVLRNNTYPLSVSAERTLQAIAIGNYANEIQADLIAHGSTGAGNDQVRFDLVFHTLCPDKEILTPIRDQELTRQQELDYLAGKNIGFEWTKAKYSINSGLWGTSVGGEETLTSDQALPDHAFPTSRTASGSKEVVLHFEKGELKGIDNEILSPVQAIRKLEEIASSFAIGRDIHVGDTIIGTKGRVGFEAAAPLIIIKSHETLEKHTLTKWQQHWKQQLASWYGMMLHEGQYLEPLMRDIETFLESTQQFVSGKVNVRLHPYRYAIQGISSENDLMNPKFGHYGEMTGGWSGKDVRGFTRIMANSIQIYHKIHSSC